MIPVISHNLRLDGDVQLEKNFWMSEFQCKDGSDVVLISLKLVRRLQKIRDWAGAPVHISSGYRTWGYNKGLKDAATCSQHCLGTAADIWVEGKTPREVAAFAETLLRGTGGIGIYDTFVHIDVRKVKARW